ncbi:MAG: hypothetical protein P8Y97_19160 [Candidatus Lokiarchaeota archaeon]
MELAKNSLIEIVKGINESKKAQKVFITNIGGKDINWDIKFQFNLENEEPFSLEIKNTKVYIHNGEIDNPDVLLTGDNKAIEKVCKGQGDFTHAISREEITVERGKVMDVIRLTRAITIILKQK